MIQKLLAVLLIWMLLFTSGCAAVPAQEQTPSPAETITAAAEPTAPTEATEAQNTGVLTAPEESPGPQLPHRFADKAEGIALMLSNEEYYSGFSQNDLDFKMQRSGATMEEYLAFAREQVLDFTEAEIAALNACFADMEHTLTEKGYTLPPLEEVVLIKTTMQEEPGAAGYTHGTQIYVLDQLLGMAVQSQEFRQGYLQTFLWHELFHCLTRSNPDFREEMYSLIHFTVQEEDFPLPPRVFEYHISNPDVERHNSYASFRINGEMIDCFTDFVTTKHFERSGETFFDSGTTALIPIDGTDTYYTPEQAENFTQIFGANTGYVLDPEECMADNFSYALAYGMEGEGGNGYPNPEIIASILDNLSR